MSHVEVCDIVEEKASQITQQRPIYGACSAARECPRTSSIVRDPSICMLKLTFRSDEVLNLASDKPDTHEDYDHDP